MLMLHVNKRSRMSQLHPFCSRIAQLDGVFIHQQIGLGVKFEPNQSRDNDFWINTENGVRKHALAYTVNVFDSLKS